MSRAVWSTSPTWVTHHYRFASTCAMKLLTLHPAPTSCNAPSLYLFVQLPQALCTMLVGSGMERNCGPSLIPRLSSLSNPYCRLGEANGSLEICLLWVGENESGKDPVPNPNNRREAT